MVLLADRLRNARTTFRKSNDELYRQVQKDPEFVRENVTLYNFDILENLDRIAAVMARDGDDLLSGLTNRTMIDIGCSNGDLGFAFESAGFSVGLLDRSHIAEEQNSQVRQDAPLVARIIARHRQSKAVVFDENIDEGFDPRRVSSAFRDASGLPEFKTFGLGVMVGVLYHLKNPYAVMEKLAQLCDHLIVGTWIADSYPRFKGNIEDEQVAYLLKDRQLAVDPTNYWIFTKRSFETLAERCGWEIVQTHLHQDDLPPLSLAKRAYRRLSNRMGKSPPDAVSQRYFMLLKAKR